MRAYKRSALLTIVLGAVLHGNVSIKNGNFFIAYTDIVFPGGFEPKIERVYNSKTPFRGMFGWGWGSEYEVFLEVQGDNTINVHEYGGGAENIFRLEDAKENLNAMVDSILQAAEKNHDVGSDQELADLRTKLLVDSSLRNDRFSDYVKLKLLTKPELTFGTEFTSHQFSSQRIRYEREGYIRSFDSGRTEFFDLRGKLVQVHDKNANSIMLSYDSRGNLAGILDNFGRKIEISIDSRGLVQQLRDPARNRTVEFKYNDKLELIYSKDVDGNEYHFDYDSKGRHNLTQIGYSDKTSVDVEYYGSEMHENVKNVKDRDGTRMAYEYVSADHNHLKVTVAVSGSDGKKLSTSIYSYVFADFNGQEVTAKIIADVDGDRTETDYDPSSNLPIRIQKGNEVTRFQYDRDGHVTLKATTEQVTEMTYDLYSHKVSQVKIYPPGKPEKATWSKFSYDDHGNLLSAQNSKSIEIKLEYDGNGRITEIIQKDGSRLQFQYNVSSKPTEIVWVAPDKTKEAIKVEYGDDGEIKNVSSPQGRSVSLKVTNAYQQLLDIIRPAGVSLNF